MTHGRRRVPRRLYGFQGASREEAPASIEVLPTVGEERSVFEQQPVAARGAHCGPAVFELPHAQDAAADRAEPKLCGEPGRPRWGGPESANETYRHATHQIRANGTALPRVSDVRIAR